MRTKRNSLSGGWLGTLLALSLLGGSVLGASAGLRTADAQDLILSNAAMVAADDYVASTRNVQRAGPPAPGAPHATQTQYLPLIARHHVPPQSLFGVHMAPINNSRGLQEAVLAQVSWVRSAVFHWAEIEPVRTDPPTYHWEVVDEASLRNAAQNRMALVAIVNTTPAWAQQLPGYLCSPVRQDRLNEFAQFMQALVDRYSRSPYYVRHWELWNEPDVDPYAFDPPLDHNSEYGCWGDQDDPSGYGGGYYAQMLKVATPAIKVADPGAQVLLGGLLLDCDPRDPPPGKDCNASNFLEGILANGGGPYFDMVSFHAYTYFAGLGFMSNPNWSDSTTSITPKVEFLRDVLQEYGFNGKPLLNTEAALLCNQDTSECRDTQAMYVPRAYAEAMALGLRAQTYYRMMNESWKFTGLLWPGLFRKPSFYAYKTASRFLRGLEYDHAAQGYPPKIAGYAFSSTDHQPFVHTDVIWTTDGSAVTVNLPPGATAYHHLYGTVLGSGTITVNYAPVYVKQR